MASMGRPKRELPADDDELVPVTVNLKVGGVRWLDEQARRMSTEDRTWTRTDVMRAALSEYKQTHPHRDARPVPKTKPRGAAK